MSTTTKYSWFRMYSEFLNDPKIIALAFEDQRHFIGLLALKCDGALDSGCAPDLLDRIVAQRLWIDHAVIREVKKRLVASGLISDDWQPLAWAKRQMLSDSSTERVARYREKKRAAAAGSGAGAGGKGPESGNGDGNVSGNGIGNGDETLQKREGNGLDTDTDTDTEEERETREDSRSPSPESKSITLKTYLADCKAKGVKPIPEDHHIRKDMEAAGISDEMAQVAWLRFKAEHMTGTRKDKRYKDWPAVFANSVNDRWYRLWVVHADGPAQWTSEGLQAKRKIEAQEAA